MRPALPLLLTALCSLGAALVPSDDSEVAIRGDGFALTRADYGRWLVERRGVDYVGDYLLEQLVLLEASERGLLPSAEEVDAAWAAERDMVLEHNFGGGLERMESDLQKKGTDLEHYRARRKSELVVELALFAMARADRTISEEQVQRRYKDVFGTYGEAVSLDVLFFSAYAGIDPDAPRPDVQALRHAAMQRATRAVEALRGGAPFEDLLAESDPPSAEITDGGLLRDGHVAQYRKNLLGPEVERAVTSLDDAGQVSPPIQVWDGAWVVRLAQRVPMTFEAARGEIERILREDTITAEELGNVQSRLREKYAAEILLR